MKFSGLHFHMVLVVALLCVIVYVFYISKDIITIDNELRSIKGQMDVIHRHLQQPIPNVDPIQDALPLVHEIISAEEDKHNDATSDSVDVDNERVRALLSKIDHEALEEQHPEGEVQQEQEQEHDQELQNAPGLTLVELKRLCKEKGLSTKGTKDQLQERLLSV